jgi:hypothetical protein
MTHLFVEFGITRLVFQDVAGGTLVLQESVFLFTLISQAEQKLDDSIEHCANFGKDVSHDLCRLFNFAGLQKHDVDPGLFNLGRGLEDLFLAQFEDRVPPRIVATHRAEFAIDPAKIRYLHQPANDDSIAENGTASVLGGGKKSLLLIIFRLQPGRKGVPIPKAGREVGRKFFSAVFTGYLNGVIGLRGRFVPH